MSRLLPPLLIAMALSVAPSAVGAETASSADAIQPLLVGASVPDVSVRDLDGKPVALRTALTKKPTAVIFYRGGW